MLLSKYQNIFPNRHQRVRRASTLVYSTPLAIASNDDDGVGVVVDLNNRFIHHSWFRSSHYWNYQNAFRLRELKVLVPPNRQIRKSQKSFSKNVILVYSAQVSLASLTFSILIYALEWFSPEKEIVFTPLLRSSFLSTPKFTSTRVFEQFWSYKNQIESSLQLSTSACKLQNIMYR